MSVEAPTMSAAPTTASAMGAIGTPGGYLASFGPEISSVSINTGGTNQPGLNNDIFSMPTLSAVPVEALSSDRAVPENLAFTHADVVWQAPQVSDNPIAEIVSKPEIFSIQRVEKIIDVKANNFIQEITEMPVAIMQQEVIADARQAVKVEEALVATGVRKEEAHVTALRVFAKTQDKEKYDQFIQIKPQEPVFEHDDKADAEREKVTAASFEKAAKKALSEGKEEITGYDLANEMPDNPQPIQIKSEIVKKGQDGSYEYFIKEIKGISNIKSGEEVKQVAQKAIANNHAIKLTDSSTSQRATEQEVAKVLKTGAIFKAEFA